MSGFASDARMLILGQLLDGPRGGDRFSSQRRLCRRMDATKDPQPNAGGNDRLSIGRLHRRGRALPAAVALQQLAGAVARLFSGRGGDCGAVPAHAVRAARKRAMAGKRRPHGRGEGGPVAGRRGKRRLERPGPGTRSHDRQPRARLWRAVLRRLPQAHGACRASLVPHGYGHLWYRPVHAGHSHRHPFRQEQQRNDRCRARGNQGIGLDRHLPVDRLSDRARDRSHGSAGPGCRSSAFC